MDFEPPWLEHRIETWANERQVLDQQPPLHVPALSGREHDFAHALQLQKWTSEACDHVSHEQEQRRLTVNLAVVVNRYGHVEAFACPDESRTALKVAERKTAVGEAVTEEKLRRCRHVEIGARIMHARRRRPTG